MIARHNIPSIPARRFAAAGMAAIGLRSISRQLLRDVRGVVLPLMAISLPVLIGFTSLGVEVGHWYLMQREMQGAADAAAISAAAQYIADYPTNPSSTTYQTVGRSYASTNGFTIPVSNVCLVTSSGDNCGTVRSLDSRAITCSTSSTALFCFVVEITNTPAAMLLAAIPAMPTPPTLKVRAIVQATSTPGTTTTTTTTGTDCVLALANDPNNASVQVSGNNADLKGNCGVAIDGGVDQNPGTPVVGWISFNGNGAKVNINSLTVAANSAGQCPSSSHCFLFSPPTSVLPACNPPNSPGNCVQTSTPTPDPYTAALNFTNPFGVKTGGVAINVAGTNYTNGTRTFTVAGCTLPNCTSPAQFTATVSGGKFTSIGPVTDPGAYTVFPTNPVSVTDTTTGTVAKFNLTEGCFNWPATPIAGRKYCSITLAGNFPPGNYYVVGNITGSGNTGATSVAAGATPPGTTFFQTNGSISITGNATYNLCAPGTVASGGTCNGTSTTCSATGGSCMLFVQKSNLGPSTVNDFSGGSSSTFSGLIYLPNETFRSGGNTTIGGCFGVVAQFVLVQGTPTFSNGCLPGRGIGGTTTTITTPTVFNPPHLSQ